MFQKLEVNDRVIVKGIKKTGTIIGYGWCLAAKGLEYSPWIIELDESVTCKPGFIKLLVKRDSQLTPLGKKRETTKIEDETIRERGRPNKYDGVLPVINSFTKEELEELEQERYDIRHNKESLENIIDKIEKEANI